MKDLIERSYAAIVRRDLIKEETNEIDFICKIIEEKDEIMDAFYEGNNDHYVEELIDLANVCFMQIKHLGYDPIKEFEKVVLKNEKRAEQCTK